MYSIPFSNYDGIEIDMLSLGDADCIVATQWHNSYPHRALIDGGCGGSYDEVVDFLTSRGYDTFWAVLCSHCHDDHASGLIRLVNNRDFTFHHAWMHDIRRHVGIDALRRASAADDGVKQVVETTAELARAFSSRSIQIQEPFAGATIAGLPNLVVLGPTPAYYQSVIAEFTKVRTSSLTPNLNALIALTARTGVSGSSGGFGTVPVSPGFYISPPAPGSLASMLSGMLSTSSVQEEPKTQPFNNTSTILGMRYNSLKYIFTADAGSDALDQIPGEWNSLEWMQVPHHGSDGNLSQDNIERFCPRFAYVSAKGDRSHPSQAIVNGLIKVGASVYSTHKGGGHLWHRRGNVPDRTGYGPAEPLKSTGGMKLPSLISIPV